MSTLIAISSLKLAWYVMAFTFWPKWGKNSSVAKRVAFWWIIWHLCLLEVQWSLEAQSLHWYISGPWSESNMGGSSGVGEGYAALAFSSTRPGQTLSPPSANYWPQYCSTTAAQWRKGHVQQGHISVHIGVRSTGECLVQLHLNLCKQICMCCDKLSLFCPSFRWRCCWNSRSLPTTSNHPNGIFLATPISRLS